MSDQQLQGGQELEGTEHTFLYGMHLEHICKHPTCEENRAFKRIQAQKGDDYIAQKLLRRASFRRYDRQYPYDIAGKAVPLENIEDLMGTEDSVLSELVATESANDFLDTLTPRERSIATRLAEGYKPREIAEQDGKSNSGSTRWMKHNIKQKALLWYEVIDHEEISAD